MYVYSVPESKSMFSIFFYFSDFFQNKRSRISQNVAMIHDALQEFYTLKSKEYPYPH